MFDKRRATLVVSDLVLVVSLDIILLRLAVPAVAVDVGGEVVVGHHHRRPSKNHRSGPEKKESGPVRKSAGKSGSVTDS